MLSSPEHKLHLAGIALSGSLLVLSGIFFYSTNKRLSSEPIPLPPEALAPALPVYVAPVEVSAPVMVDPKLVAEKVDLQRKLITPKSAQDVASIRRTVEEAGGEVIQSSENAVVVELPKDAEAQVTQELIDQEAAAGVEVDYPVALLAESVDWGITQLEIPEVWPTTQGAGVRVAVVDTGVDYTHPDLANRYVGGYDFINDDTDPVDDHGHGTHVSGIIAATANDIGGRGAASQASVVGLKVLNADGIGYTSDIVEAVDWAMANDVQVINFSLGTTYNSSALESKLQEAQNAGIYMVAAAGNTFGGSLLYPAAYTSVMSVSATDQGDNFAAFSSLGAEFAAPGVGITSAVPGGYATWSGTSMASPHVAGTVALMVANGQSNIRLQLRNTSLDLGDAGRDLYYGYGRIMSKPAVLEQDVLAPAVTFVAPVENGVVDGVVRVSLDVQDENQVMAVGLFANEQLLTSWRQEPYEYNWDTSDWAGQEVTLVAQAVDDSDNVGAAQLTVSVAPELQPSPTISPVPSPSLQPSPSASASAKPISQDSGQSSDNRQDQNSPSMDVRQDTNNAPKELPPVTNIDRRNPQGESSQEKEHKGKSDGAAASSGQGSGSSNSSSTGNSASDNAQNNNASENGRRPEVRGVATEQRAWWKFWQ